MVSTYIFLVIDVICFYMDHFRMVRFWVQSVSVLLLFFFTEIKDQIKLATYVLRVKSACHT